MNAAHYTIRKFEENDLSALVRIYHDSIHQLAAKFYSKDQVIAWSGFADDAEAFSQWIKSATTFVAVSENTCIGFGGLQKHGRISSLFVTPDYARKGVGTGLLKALHEEAKLQRTSIITTEASELSKPLFEKYGFTVIEIEHTVIKGIEFKRFKMQVYND